MLVLAVSQLSLEYPKALYWALVSSSSTLMIIADGLSSTVRLFADDTMIYLAVKNEQDARIFQEDLDKLTTWEKRWMMEFHLDKCEVIIPSPGKETRCSILTH